MSGSDRGAGASPAMTCTEVAELAGLFVLDALDPAERAAVAAHLATCAEAHSEFAEIAGVVPALASLAEPIDAPAALRERVLAAASGERRTAPATGQATVRPLPPRAAADATGSAMARPRPAWLTWTAAAAAVVLVAVLGSWALIAQTRADQEAQRAAQLASALRVLSAPDSAVAILRGSGSATAASGFAAYAPDGTGYLVVTGLPQIPAGRTYQAWFIVDGTPQSAGLLTVGADSFALLSGTRATGTDVVALTVEPVGGSPLPTSEPIVAGELRPNV